MSAPRKRRSTERRRRPPPGCGAPRPAAAASGTGRGWCPGTRRRARAGSCAGSARAPRGRARAGSTRANEQVVEVHRVHRVDPLLVELVDVGGRLLEEGADLHAVGAGVEQLVLGVRDLALDRARREALGVDVELLDAVLDQPHRVGLVVDREAARVAEPLARPSAASARRPSGRSSPTSRAARLPTSFSTRSRISCAALLVKVIARISPGCACRCGPGGRSGA